jgi:hypothetical protein
MRLNDLNDGSIKALLILGLLLANVTAAHLRHPGSRKDSEAREPVELTPKVSLGDPSTSPGMTMSQVKGAP